MSAAVPTLVHQQQITTIRICNREHVYLKSFKIAVSVRYPTQWYPSTIGRAEQHKSVWSTLKKVHAQRGDISAYMKYPSELQISYAINFNRESNVDVGSPRKQAVVGNFLDGVSYFGVPSQAFSWRRAYQYYYIHFPFQKKTHGLKSHKQKIFLRSPCGSNTSW